MLRKRESELEGMQNRLLNTHISGSIRDEIFTKKYVDYKDIAVAIFDLTQRAAETWKGSNNAF